MLWHSDNSDRAGHEPDPALCLSETIYVPCCTAQVASEQSPPPGDEQARIHDFDYLYEAIFNLLGVDPGTPASEAQVATEQDLEEQEIPAGPLSKNVRVISSARYTVFNNPMPRTRAAWDEALARLEGRKTGAHDFAPGWDKEWTFLCKKTGAAVGKRPVLTWDYTPVQPRPTITQSAKLDSGYCTRPASGGQIVASATTGEPSLSELEVEPLRLGQGAVKTSRVFITSRPSSVSSSVGCIDVRQSQKRRQD